MNDEEVPSAFRGSAMSDQICGRSYEFTKPAEGVKARVIVEGITHVGGTEKHPNTGKPIRFKSLQSAENHIRNMRLEKLEG